MSTCCRATDRRPTAGGLWFWSMCCVIIMTSVNAGTARAGWLSRTVTEVNGSFSNMQPAFGFERGLGTSRVDWGDPLPGSFTSFLSFQGYDALPGVSQPWFFGGQTVSPGGSFLMGTITFRNGSVTSTSSAQNLHVDLNVTVFGAEFEIDNHPLLASDTLGISVVQTPNQGVDKVADADYIYFTNFPFLGRFLVYEGQTTSVQVYGRFGSIDPAGFGAVDDPTAGIVLPLETSVPAPPSIVLCVGALGCLVVRRGIGRLMTL